jgi:hypothetical protein
VFNIFLPISETIFFSRVYLSKNFKKTMLESLESEYAYWPYVIAQVLFMGGTAIILLCGVALFLHAYFSGRVSIWHLRILAFFLFGICCCVCMALGVAQGMDQIHPAGSVIVGIILWVISLPLIFLFSGGDAEAVLWLRSDAHLVSVAATAVSNSNNNNNSDGGGADQEMKSRGNLAKMMTEGGDGNNNNSNNQNPIPSYSLTNSFASRHSQQNEPTVTFKLDSPSDNNNPNAWGGEAEAARTASSASGRSIANFQADYHNVATQCVLASAPSGIDGLKGPGAKREYLFGGIVSAPSTSNIAITPSRNVSQSNFSPTTSSSSQSQHHFASTSTPSHQYIMQAKKDMLERQQRRQQEEEELGAKNKNNNNAAGTAKQLPFVETEPSSSSTNNKNVKRKTSQDDSDLDILNHSSKNNKIRSSVDSDFDIVIEQQHSSGNKKQENNNNTGSAINLDDDDDIFGPSPPATKTKQENNNIGKSSSNSKNETDSICTEPAHPEPVVTAASGGPPYHNYSIVERQQQQQKATNSLQLLSRQDRIKIYLKNFFSLMVRDIKRRPVIFIGFVLFAVLTILVCNLMLFGICIMNKPQTVSTWITRKYSKKTNFCPAGTGKPCFTYPLVGSTCSSIVLASHFVVGSDAEIPNMVQARVCFRHQQQNCSTIAGYVRNLDNIAEDRRYVGNIYINNLICGEEYSTTVSFFNSADPTKLYTSDEICFFALPGDVVASSYSTSPSRTPQEQQVIANQVEELTFLEGGDYVVKGRSSSPSKGKTLLERGLQHLKHAGAKLPAFFSILGDIAYENNMRRCYRRVDEYLFEVLDVLRVPSSTTTSSVSSQCIIPQMTGVGNHDSGGYLYHGDRRTISARMEMSTFYFQYFPFLSWDNLAATQDQPENETSISASTLVQAANVNEIGDYTDTFRIHLIGSNTSYIVADSGHWSPLHIQADRLRSALNKIRQLNRTAVVSYHVPSYPSTRDKDSSNAFTDTPNRPRETFEAFVPVLKENDDIITVVFEHHDHNYKRTERMIPQGDTQIIISETANSSSWMKIHQRQKGRGLIFNGDGALGASSEDPVALEAPPLKIGFSGNYVSVVRMFSNGSLHVKAIAMGGELVDDFMLI